MHSLSDGQPADSSSTSGDSTSSIASPLLDEAQAGVSPVEERWRAWEASYVHPDEQRRRFLRRLPLMAGVTLVVGSQLAAYRATVVERGFDRVVQQTKLEEARQDRERREASYRQYGPPRAGFNIPDPIGFHARPDLDYAGVGRLRMYASFVLYLGLGVVATWALAALMRRRRGGNSRSAGPSN